MTPSPNIPPEMQPYRPPAFNPYYRAPGAGNPPPGWGPNCWVENREFCDEPIGPWLMKPGDQYPPCEESHWESVVVCKDEKYGERVYRPDKPKPHKPK